MILPFLLAGVSIMCTLEKAFTSSSDDEIIPDDIHSWCPYTKFCDSEQVKPIPTMAMNKQQPCCRSCSCDPSCGLTRSCCTDKHDIHRVDETLGTICKPLSRLDRNHYYIVDKCPDKQDTCRSLNTNTQDGFSPVFSTTNRNVYFNRYCASCHNVSEIVEFQSSLVCPSLYDGSFSNKIFEAIKGNEDECYLHFLIPTDVDLSSERCHLSLIQNCIDTSPNYLKELCAGFNSTYVHRSNFREFKNVYCYLCRLDYLPSQKEWQEGNMMCPVVETNRALSKSTLVVLLDKTSVDNYQTSASGQESDRVVCFESNDKSQSKKCQPVLCPFGQLRVKGSCSFIGQTWYVSNLQLIIRLNLSGRDGLTVDDFLQLDTDQLEEQARGVLTHLGLKKWKIELYFNANQNESNVEYFIAVLILRNEWINPSYVFNKLDKILNSEWSVFGLNVNPSFNEYSKYLMIENTTYVNDTFDAFSHPNFWLTGQMKQDLIYSLAPNSIFYEMGFESSKLIITKLFFCEQVDLPLDVFYISSSKAYINKTGKILGTNEYQESEMRDGDTFVIRICLSDYLPYIANKSGSNKVDQCFILLELILVSLGVLI